MYQTYDIYLKDRVVGQATVNKAGLYCAINAVAKFHEPGFYRLMLQSGTRNVDLGLFVPSGEMYILNKKIPYKHIATQPYEFNVIPRDQTSIQAEKSQELNIEKLQSYALFKTESNEHIIIDQSATQPDNDLSQEHLHK